MPIGDNTHKKAHLENLIKQCAENIWTLEVKRLIQEDDVKEREKQLAAAKEMLEKKMFPSGYRRRRPCQR